jgi:hypothetical protein
MAAGFTSDIDSFIEFCRTLPSRESVSAEEAILLYRGQSGGRAQEPRTELVRNLRRLRQEYLASGGRLSSPEEIEDEVRELRGERYPSD